MDIIKFVSFVKMMINLTAVFSIDLPVDKSGYQINIFLISVKNICCGIDLDKMLFSVQKY